MIFTHLVEGGIWFMLPIYLMWIAVIVLIVLFLAKYKKTQTVRRALIRMNELIVFLGSLALLYGLLGQVIGFFEALSAIERVGKMAPALIAGGLKISFLAPIYGFVLFLLSGIAWFVFRNMLRE